MKYIHQRGEHNFTVAFETNAQNGTITLGLAKCHSKDCFNKKTGRKIAEGRQQKHPIKMFYNPGLSHKENVNRMMEKLNHWVEIHAKAGKMSYQGIRDQFVYKPASIQ